jgi:hypothetical protein
VRPGQLVQRRGRVSRSHCGQCGRRVRGEVPAWHQAERPEQPLFLVGNVAIGQVEGNADRGVLVTVEGQRASLLPSRSSRTWSATERRGRLTTLAAATRNASGR